MAKIRGEVDTTPEQERALNETYLPTINEQRVEDGFDPFADMDEYADWLLSVAMPSWVDQSHKKEKKDVGDAYEEADPATQAAVDELLGL